MGMLDPLLLRGFDVTNSESSQPKPPVEAKLRKNEKLLLGLGSLSVYIEDRYLDEEEGFGRKYKVFLNFRILWVCRTFTFRVGYLGYFTD